MERFSTGDLLELISSNQLPFIFKILFTLFTKQASLMWRSSVLSLPLQLVFPGVTYMKTKLLFRLFCLKRYELELVLA